MVPFRTIAMGQQRLQATIERTAGTTTHVGYGVVLHVRKERTRATLGIITLAGESLPLTARLLSTIADRPLLLAGQTRVTLGLLDAGAMSEPDRGLEMIIMQVLPEDTRAADAEPAASAGDLLAGVEALVSADTLLQPLVLLLPSRPVGWPR